jgi:GNAT superfamily N-acetyltransferase
MTYFKVMTNSNNKFAIRETTAADLEEILLHRRLMFRDMGQTDEAELDAMVATSRPCVKRYLDDRSYRGWFAMTAEGRVAAGAGLIVMPAVSRPQHAEQTERPYFLNVYTYAEFRRQGLARKLTEECIAWCREQGYAYMWLHASQYGRPLYESMGFEVTNEMVLQLK